MATVLTVLVFVLGAGMLGLFALGLGIEMAGWWSYESAARARRRRLRARAEVADEQWRAMLASAQGLDAAAAARVCDVLASSLGVAPTQIRLSDRFDAELGLFGSSSLGDPEDDELLGFQNIVCEGLNIPDAAMHAAATVGDVVALVQAQERGGMMELRGGA